MIENNINQISIISKVENEISSDSHLYKSLISY